MKSGVLIVAACGVMLLCGSGAEGRDAKPSVLKYQPNRAGEDYLFLQDKSRHTDFWDVAGGGAPSAGATGYQGGPLSLFQLIHQHADSQKTKNNSVRSTYGILHGKTCQFSVKPDYRPAKICQPCEKPAPNYPNYYNQLDLQRISRYTPLIGK